MKFCSIIWINKYRTKVKRDDNENNVQLAGTRNEKKFCQISNTPVMLKIWNWTNLWWHIHHLKRFGDHRNRPVSLLLGDPLDVESPCGYFVGSYLQVSDDHFYTAIQLCHWLYMCGRNGSLSHISLINIEHLTWHQILFYNDLQYMFYIPEHAVHLYLPYC